ncbi:glycosyltransferase [Cyanobium sp. Morenito 9A2]|uniref:glycosyltransferase family 2 protein n=1 Tax=Cyanobium sp. Morenito 9A2 TaxID=2823718 RepID=UPI0020CEC1A6|nr:cellulose synthase catalytic subunit [Cyanobium sp. Morenito 9A2]MCP9850790.1 glycosyltransferase [Cyanobium sp. Morenito 9A2]
MDSGTTPVPVQAEPPGPTDVPSEAPAERPASTALPYVLWGALPLAATALVPPGGESLVVLTVVVWALGLSWRPEALQPLAARRSAVLVLAVLGLRYLTWRFASTLNLASPGAAALSLLLLTAELVLLANGFLQLALTWFPQRPVAEVPPPADRVWPSVDVLVPSYGEPPELIERCLRGCRALDYPHHKVWLLDDSGRPELEQLCADLGCRYLSRSDRRHAKAGNLNHALEQAEGELVVVFDADVVPLEPFLRRTVGLFADPAVGFVQTPQSYMTADPIMRNLRLERWLMPDEESFYRWIEPTRAAVGAVVCAGTSFVVRRSALEAVGRFETGTASEDLATGIRITAAGYRNLYLDEKLSAGLAPLTAAAMARQRSRWASGTLQTLRTGANPLTIPGLSPLQRLAYLEGIQHWFNVIPQLLLLLMPLSLGLLRVVPIRLSAEGLLAVALPFYLGQILLLSWFSRGSRSAVMPELYRWIFLIPITVAVVATGLGHPQRFHVTPKALSPQRRQGPEPRLLLPLLALLAIQLLNLVHLVIGPDPSRAVPPVLTPAGQTLGLAWSGLSVVLLLLALRTCWDRLPPTVAPWFARDQWVTLRTGGAVARARLLALGEEGAEWRLDAGVSPPAAGALVVVEGLLAQGRPLPLRLEQRNSRGREGWQLGGRWQGLEGETQDALQHELYRRKGLWPTRQAPFEPRALLAAAVRLVLPLGGRDWFQRSLLPQQPGCPPKH